MTFRRHESMSSFAFIDPCIFNEGIRGNTRDALNHWNLCRTGGGGGGRERDPLRAVSFTFHYGIICHASVDPLSLADHKQPWHKFQLSRITWRRTIDRPATEKFITLKSTDRDAREMRVPTSVSLLQVSLFSFLACVFDYRSESCGGLSLTGDEDRGLFQWRCVWEYLVWVDVTRGHMKSWTLPISVLGRFTRSLHLRRSFEILPRIVVWRLDWRGWIRKYDFSGEELKNRVSEFYPRLCKYAFLLRKVLYELIEISFSSYFYFDLQSMRNT